MTKRIAKISNCSQCPWLRDNDGICMEEGRPVPHYGDVIPDWCPLPKADERDIAVRPEENTEPGVDAVETWRKNNA